MAPAQENNRWISAWPDLVAFVLVLGIAWWTRARTADLVWSLWLSSLIVGYAIILSAIFRFPLMFLAVASQNPRSVLRDMAGNGVKANVILGVVALIAMAFTLAFFTVHFGGFHYVHASFLDYLFPIVDKWNGSTTLRAHDLAMYGEVLRRYWIYLPAAFLGERAVFLHPPRGSIMMLPYSKVLRMHGLIFFFGLAHVLHFDNFAVYAVVYAVYFFPWRLVSRAAPVPDAAPAERAAA